MAECTLSEKSFKVSKKLITRLEKYTGIPHACQYKMQEVSTRLKESYHPYYELKSIASEVRESWLMELAAMKAKELSGDKHKHYINLIQRERQRISSKRMKCIFGKMKGQGLTQAVVTQDGSIKEFTTKEDIESACHAKNKKKFSQTNNTPVMTEPLAEKLGYDGLLSVCQQILDGTYTPPPGTDEYTIAYFKELKRPPQVLNPPQASVSTSVFKEGWKKINENISSGLTGIHYGHMKACAMDDMLSDFKATICHVPYSTGYSPMEWKTSINTMIPKRGKKPEV